MAFIDLAPQPVPETDIHTLLDASKCINSCIPVGMQMPVLIYLMQQMSGNGMTTDQLMQAAACNAKCIPVGMQRPIIIYLLDQILQNLEAA